MFVMTVSVTKLGVKNNTWLDICILVLVCEFIIIYKLSAYHIHIALFIPRNPSHGNCWLFSLNASS